MSNPIVLTKFTTYHEESFALEPSHSIKMSLPIEFNDVLDSQIYLSEKQLKEFSKKFSWDAKSINKYIERLNNSTHIVSFSANRANSILNANMWGIYANNGKGIAFEFDYDSINDIANPDKVILLMKTFTKIENEVYQNSLLKPYEIERKKYEKKFNYIKTKDGALGLKFFTERSSKIDDKFESYSLDKKIIFFDKYLKKVFAKEINANSKIYTPFLVKVGYTTDGSIINYYVNNYLKQTYEFLKSERKIYDTPNFFQFYSTKSIIWQHEHEYRLFCPYYFEKDYIKQCNKLSFEEQKHLLEKFQKTHYFYKFNEKPINDLIPTSGQKESTELLNLPFPKKIFLGWRFAEEDKSGSKVEIIKNFCKKYHVELFKLTSHVDLNFNEFICNKEIF